MDTNSLELVKEFAEKIEVLGGNLFEIAMKQQMVHVTSSLMVITCLCFAVVIGYMSYIRRCDSMANDYEKNSLRGFCLIVLFFISAMIIFYLQILIQWLLNPEYAAIGEVMKLVNAAT